MKNNNVSNDIKLVDEIKILLNEHDNNINQVKEVLNKRLIICRVFGYLVTIAACCFIIFSIAVTPWKCFTTVCPPGAMDYIAFLLLPLIILLIISVTFIRSIIRTKKLLEKLSSFEALQYNKGSSEKTKYL